MGKYIALMLSSIAWGCVSNPYDKLEQVSKTCEDTYLKGYIHKDESLHVEIECKEDKEDVPR